MQCIATKANGIRCRRVVAKSGERCARHREIKSPGRLFWLTGYQRQMLIGILKNGYEECRDGNEIEALIKKFSNKETKR